MWIQNEVWWNHTFKDQVLDALNTKYFGFKKSFKISSLKLKSKLQALSDWFQAQGISFPNTLYDSMCVSTLENLQQIFQFSLVKFGQALKFWERKLCTLPRHEEEKQGDFCGKNYQVLARFKSCMKVIGKPTRGLGIHIKSLELKIIHGWFLK